MTVRGFTMVDDEGLYNIYLNDRLSEATQERTLEHELRHIMNGDFERAEPGHVLN